MKRREARNRNEKGEMGRKRKRENERRTRESKRRSEEADGEGMWEEEGVINRGKGS